MKILFLPVFAAAALAAQASVFEIHAVEAKSSAKTKTFTIEGAGRQRTVILNNDVLIDRSALADARVTQEPADASGKGPKNTVPAIRLTLTKAGLDKVTEVTTALVGRQVGVLIDGKLIATPTVREKVRRDSLTLIGNFTKEEAAAMVGKIKSGK